MIPLEKQCVSLEFAKRLKELGVNQESLFYWMDDGCGHITLRDMAWNNGRRAIASAFTVAELGEMLPDNRTRIFKTLGIWCGELFELNNHYAPPKEGERFCSGASEADARAKMLIYSVEIGLLTLEPSKAI